MESAWSNLNIYGGSTGCFRYLTSLGIHFVSINKVIGKKVPQLYCIVMKNSYYSCFIDIEVSMAT